MPADDGLYLSKAEKEKGEEGEEEGVCGGVMHVCVCVCVCMCVCVCVCVCGWGVCGGWHMMALTPTPPNHNPPPPPHTHNQPSSSKKTTTKKKKGKKPPAVRRLVGSTFSSAVGEEGVDVLVLLTRCVLREE